MRHGTTPYRDDQNVKIVVVTSIGVVLLRISVIVSAHYDAATDCSGADGNATGVAAVLEAARILAANNNKGDFILIASDDKARQQVSTLNNIADQKNLPTINLEVSCSQKTSTLYATLHRSDHSVFWLQDYPAIMITDTANYRNPYYHCGYGATSDTGQALDDAVEQLDFDFAVLVTDVITQAANEALISQN